MVRPNFVLAPATVRVRVAIEPAYNCLDSIMILHSAEKLSGLHQWITTTYADMTSEQRHTNLLLSHLAIAIPEEKFDSLPAYINYIAAQEPAWISQRAIEQMCRYKVGNQINHPQPDELLSDLYIYLDYVKNLYSTKDYEPDASLHTEIHALLNQPRVLQELMVNHLREMWREYLAQEWTRVLPMIQESVHAFQQIDYSGMTASEAIRAVTGRDLRGIWDDLLNDTNELLFLPVAHAGPYISIARHGAHVTCIMFSARLPEVTNIQSPTLNRSELLVRLNALADDVRLQILGLLAEHDELCAQDVISMLDLSQSAASRHLKQLAATGYLIERRRENAKCYRLNSNRIETTTSELRHFLQRKGTTGK